MGRGVIPINGLIWMGDGPSMMRQVKEKLAAGFRCIKLKIGALDFDTELNLLRKIRKEHPASEVTLRVDANGAFPKEQALEKLKRLSDFDLHSIEQPIRKGQWEAMAALCAASPLPIALDEELIGVADVTNMQMLLQTIQPHYLILKPSLLGGYSGCEAWMNLAGKEGIKWWITSALESNVGLNAIAQWTFQLHPDLPQGLGTGGLFKNNFSSPLTVGEGCLSYKTNKEWTPNILDELCI